MSITAAPPPPVSQNPIPGDAVAAVFDPGGGQPMSPLPGLPPLTRGARLVFVVLAVLFVAAVSLRLNGSSSDLWGFIHLGDIQIRDSHSGVILGVPRTTRTDEWMVWTPAMLSQAHQPNPFPVSNPSLGPGTTPLLMSLPARHYTMFFRPQLWGFFVAPFDYGFAWYWNVKVFGLFAALFSLCWVLTGGRLGLSLFGAVAVQFSGFVQWWFSTPAMLPEMLACWSLGVVAAIACFLPLAGWKQAVSVAVLAGSLAHLVLCCYPAFAIPLLQLGVCLVAGYVWQMRLGSWKGTALVAGAVAAAALLLLPWFLECLPTMQIEAHTIYPGQRRTYGGGFSLIQYLSGLFTLGTDEKNFAPGSGNICEGANFYPLWLLPLGLGCWKFACFVRRREVDSVGAWLANRGMKIALAGYLVLITLYMLVPLPHWLCEVTLLNRSLEGRSVVALGMAGTLLLVLCLAARPVRPEGFTRAAVYPLLLWSAGILLALWGWQAQFPSVLTDGRVAGFAATAVFGAVTYLFGPRWLLPVAWTVAFVLKLALVNPVCAGLPTLLESPALEKLRAIVRADPTAEWAVYRSWTGVELVKTAGAHVINGARIIPDPALIDRLDPTRRNWDKFNSYGYLLLQDAPYQQEVAVTLDAMRKCTIALNPRRLRELFPEVRYVLATAAAPGLREAGFQLVGCVPENNLWVYRLTADRPPVGAE